MILVTGATGSFGSAAIKHLINKGVATESIGGLVRNEENATLLKEQGVNIQVGDYADTDSMVKAFKGVDQLLLISSNDRGAIENRTLHHTNAIKAATEAGVKHVVYTSFVRTTGHENSAIAGFQNSHLESERFLVESGLNYTILRNGIYQEMVPAFIGQNVFETGTILFPAKDGKASWVLRDELAEVASNVLITKGHDQKTYHLTHTESVGFEQIAKILSTIGGKEVQYNSPILEEFKAILESSGVPGVFIGMLTMWGTGVAEGMMDLKDDTLESLLGRKPTTVRQFLERIYG